MEGTQPRANPVSINNQSAFTNSTATAITALVYVFTPAGFDIKLILVTLLAVFGVIGLVGNILIIYFVSKKKSVPFLQSSLFLRNFNLYIKSLALSDILSCLISLPLICTQIMYDVFQNGLPCRIVRYLGLAFPNITVNNLIAISTERFFSTRAVPRPLSVTTVRKLLYTAWIAGFLISLFPAGTMNGVRNDINATHYTVVCKYDTSYLAYRVIIIGFVLIQHLIPSVALICINLIVARRVWKMSRRRIDIQQDNVIRARIRSQHIKATYLLIIVTLGFVIPYSAALYYAVYVVVAKPSLDFQDDFVTRYLSVVLFLSSSAINFIIHLVQMKDFRVFLMKILSGNGDVIAAPANPM